MTDVFNCFILGIEIIISLLKIILINFYNYIKNSSQKKTVMSDCGECASYL